MRKPTKKKVLKHFEKAIKVRCLFTGKVVDYRANIKSGIFSPDSTSDSYWMDLHDNNYEIYSNGKYAEIVEYKLERQIEVGDIVVMTNAGGWGYHPDNNGCLAIITGIDVRSVSSKPVASFKGTVLNPNIDQRLDFNEVPLTNRSEEELLRLASQTEIEEAGIEIEGYRLIDPKYTEAVLKLEGGYSIGTNIGVGKQLLSKDRAIRLFRDLNLLDVWFKPVYKTPTKLPRINGYEGTDKNDYFIYGCAEIPKVLFTTDWNRSVKSLTLSSGVTINEEQVTQIKKYLEENN